MLNLADYISFSNLFSGYLKTIGRLNLKLLMFCRRITSFKILIFKFRILEILNFHPCIRQLESYTHGHDMKNVLRRVASSLLYEMDLVARKLVFGVSDKASFKPVSLATEIS